MAEGCEELDMAALKKEWKERKAKGELGQMTFKLYAELATRDHIAKNYQSVGKKALVEQVPEEVIPHSRFKNVKVIKLKKGSEELRLKGLRVHFYGGKIQDIWKDTGIEGIEECIWGVSKGQTIDWYR